MRNTATRFRLTVAATATAMATLLAACGDSPTAPVAVSAPANTPTASPAPPTTTARPVYVVAFTHIEDHTPTGSLGSSDARASYLSWRNDLLAMAGAARRAGVPWVLQPDWKYLEAARLYETAEVMASTGGRNVFAHLRDALGVIIDPHSHENGGYNYADVAYLLEQLGVGGSTVVGGHIWDPNVPQFGEWDRFRGAISGEKYPQAVWRGDILMGGASPGHRNDPVVSGVWRPADRWDYFTDSPTGNIVAVGGFSNDLDGITTLIELAGSGVIDAGCMLTSTIGIKPADFSTANGLASVEQQVLAPLAALRGGGQVVLTDFQSLVSSWRTTYGSKGCLYQR